MGLIKSILINHPKNWIDASENNFFKLLSFFLENMIVEFYSEKFIDIINDIAKFSLEIINDYPYEIKLLFNSQKQFK